MRYVLPARGIPIEPIFTSTDPKFMPDADPDLKVNSSPAGQDAANGDNSPLRGGMTLHERGSNASPAGSSPVVLE